MDLHPKRLTKEEHIGRVFNGREVISVISERITNEGTVSQLVIRIWLTRCQVCGLEHPCDQRQLRRSRCFSPTCRKIPGNKSSFRKPRNKNAIPRISERNVPAFDDPRWEKFIKPVFDSLPLHPQEITRCLTRHALAWMEEKEIVFFDPIQMIWDEHPEHMKERLIAAAKVPIA